MGDYVLARKDTKALCGETYWTGDWQPCGRAKISPNHKEAATWDSPEEANVAGTTKYLLSFRAVRLYPKNRGDGFITRWWA